MTRTPLISVLTPSLNCGTYIRQCIESVLTQDYPRFEHIVVDGCSKDDTLDVLRQYRHVRWISEPDHGEGEALNKALRMAKGDVLVWLNADDFLLPGAFRAVAAAIAPDQGRHVVYGKANQIDAAGNILVEMPPPLRSLRLTLPRLLQWFRPYDLYQCSLFFTRAVLEDAGPFRDDYFYSIDFDFWLRIAMRGYTFHYVDRVLAHARMERPDAKSRLGFERQERFWFRVSLSHLHRLSVWRKAEFWAFYSVYWLRCGLARRWPVPVRLVRPVLRCLERALGGPQVSSGARDPGVPVGGDPTP